jgi:hypothetical protein
MKEFFTEGNKDNEGRPCHAYQLQSTLPPFDWCRNHERHEAHETFALLNDQLILHCLSFRLFCVFRGSYFGLLTTPNILDFPRDFYMSVSCE